MEEKPEIGREAGPGREGGPRREKPGVMSLQARGLGDCSAGRLNHRGGDSDQDRGLESAGLGRKAVEREGHPSASRGSVKSHTHVLVVYTSAVTQQFPSLVFAYETWKHRLQTMCTEMFPTVLFAGVEDRGTLGHLRGRKSKPGKVT